jgi:hypothetical protein
MVFPPRLRIATEMEQPGRGQDTGKMVINFAEPAREIAPLKLTKNGRVRHLQGLRYTNFERE